MRLRSLSCLLAAAGLIVLSSVPLAAQTARADVPGLTVRFLGEGTPAAINATNQVVGFRDVAGVRRAVRFDPVPTDLPLLGGTGSCEATDINDLGVIVGTCGPDLYQPGRAVMWTPAAGRYEVTALATFSGDIGSSAAAINNLGEVVGVHNYRSATGLQVGTGFVWRAGAGAIDILQTYGMNDFPVDINDARQVLAGQRVLDLTTGGITELGVPPGPPAYFAARTAAISPNGTIAGTGVPAASSNPQKVIRYRNGAWQVLGGWGQYDGGAAVNDAGSVAGRGVAYLGGNRIAGVAWFDQIGTLLYLDDFLVDSARDWSILSAVDMNGDESGGGGVPGVGRIVGTGTNPVTNQYGAVILEPAGALPVPNAPSALTAVPRDATWQQPYNAITLAWTDNSRTDWGFRVERSAAGAGAWTELARTVNVSYEDTTGALGVTYDYRIRAIGLAGDSLPSNSARATFPATPVDTTPPTVRFLAPTDGSVLTGNVQIVVEASDDRALNFVDVTYQPNSGQPRICSASTGATTYRLTCTWSTRGLPPGSYQLTAYASDAIGNYSTQTITVQVGSTANPTMRVTAIALSAAIKRGSVTVTGSITVKDGSGTPLKSAGVWVTWTTPAGSRTAFAYTDRRGVATITESGGRGVYMLTVTDVVLTGYTFDAAASQLSASLTVP